MALYAPGTDFAPTLASIRYLRQCGSPLVAEYATFHLYFGSGHVPKSVPRADRDSPAVDCSAPPPWTNATAAYKGQKKLLYPVNVGRNVARESATTHYVLPSDIELYPSPGVIDGFMDLVRRQDPPLRRPKPMVFPLPIFELAANTRLPADKKELVSDAPLCVFSLHPAKYFCRLVRSVSPFYYKIKVRRNGIRLLCKLKYRLKSGEMTIAALEFHF